MKNTSLILDFETLDTTPRSVITEIGIIAVRRSDFEIIDRLSTFPHTIPQLAMGRSFTVDTIQWAQKKNLIPGPPSTHTLAESIKMLHDFIARHDPFRIWAWGKDFERPLFEDASAHCNLKLPSYQFRKFACARDAWQNAFGMETNPPERIHRAHQDVIDELRDLRDALSETNLLHMF